MGCRIQFEIPNMALAQCGDMGGLKSPLPDIRGPTSESAQQADN